MIYGKEYHILSTKDVETFFHHLVHERKVNFHPDDMFEDYVSCEGGINSFTIDECAIYNRLMDECFRVCDNEGVDIYSIGLKELQTTHKRNQVLFHCNYLKHQNFENYHAASNLWVSKCQS